MVVLLFGRVDQQRTAHWCPAGGHDVPHHGYGLSGEHLGRLAPARFQDGAPGHRVRRPSEEVLRRARADQAGEERLR